MRYIAFLRAINVGEHTVKMDRLRGLFESFGFKNARTFIASGNVLFDSDEQDTAKLEKQIEAGLEKALGYEVATFIRTPAELTRIAAWAPFAQSEVDAAHNVYIGFLRQPLDDAAREKLLTLASDVDRFGAHERELYWLCRVASHESKISNVALEKKLAARLTLRAVSSVRRLVDTCL